MQTLPAATPALENGPIKSAHDGTRTQRRTLRMRENLVTIAEALLIEGGANAVTAEEVARRADVSLQTVYNRIGGKSALLNAVAERSVQENRAYMDVAYNAECSTEERMHLVFRAYVRFAIERPHQFRIIANPPEDPAAAGHIAAIGEEHLAKLIALLTDAVKEQIVSPDLNPTTVAMTLWAMLNGVLTMSLRAKPSTTESLSAQDLIETALQLIEAGLQGSEAPRGARKLQRRRMAP